ncbi:MAG: type II toxin-antitoxin system VapC family toxin [Pyrinomonadaceae bacterium]|nr:type II toxin-antitoxin system VapC family toxin [Pyrinomonadaceae bacterium]
MKAVLVDSSVLIDVLLHDENWFEWSSSAVTTAGNQAEVVINPIIFAEISAQYRTIDELNTALPLSLCRRDDLPYAAAFLAARAFVKYRRRGGSRTSPMPDFYIGAHAEVSNFRILTRDPRRFRKYFPNVELITP